ncbi:MAG: HIT family protein [Candidatus Magasanikbacteria bacterium]|nr:HIT family protein [Candidatus Magasanikbacteria bacterium]
MESCIFCQIVEKKIPAHVIFEDDTVLAFLDIYPKTKGHTLLIPKMHAETVLDVPKETLRHIGGLSQDIALALKQACGFDGITVLNSNGAIAQQEIPHYHMHLIPRYSGEAQRLSFATQYTDTALADTAILIRNQFPSSLSIDE